MVVCRAKVLATSKTWQYRCLRFCVYNNIIQNAQTRDVHSTGRGRCGAAGIHRRRRRRRVPRRTGSVSARRPTE